MHFLSLQRTCAESAKLLASWERCQGYQKCPRGTAFLKRIKTALLVVVLSKRHSFMMDQSLQLSTVFLYWGNVNEKTICKDVAYMGACLLTITVQDFQLKMGPPCKICSTEYAGNTNVLPSVLMRNNRPGFSAKNGLSLVRFAEQNMQAIQMSSPSVLRHDCRPGF